MYCKNCGKKIANDSTFCQYCGTKMAHNHTPCLDEQDLTTNTHESKHDKSIYGDNRSLIHTTTKNEKFDWTIVAVIILAIIGVFCGILFWDWIRENYPIAFIVLFGIPFIGHVIKDMLD